MRHPVTQSILRAVLGGTTGVFLGLGFSTSTLWMLVVGAVLFAAMLVWLVSSIFSIEQRKYDRIVGELQISPPVYESSVTITEVSKAGSEDWATVERIRAAERQMKK